MSNLVIGAIFLSLAASIWGAMYVVVKVVVEVVPPLELVWMRYLIAVIALWIIGIMMRQSWKIAKRLADPISCWPYWEHDFHCDTGNGHNAVHRTDGGNYYGDNPCFYGSLRPFDFKRKHYAEKVLVYRSCHDWRGDHCRQRANRRDTAIRRTLFTTCCLNVGIDVGIRQKVPSHYSQIVVTTYTSMIAVMLLTPFVLPRLKNLDLVGILQPTISGACFT